MQDLLERDVSPSICPGASPRHRVLDRRPSESEGRACAFCAHQHEVGVLGHVPPDAQAHVAAVCARHSAVFQHVLRVRVRVLHDVQRCLVSKQKRDLLSRLMQACRRRAQTCVQLASITRLRRCRYLRWHTGCRRLARHWKAHVDVGEEEGRQVGDADLLGAVAPCDAAAHNACSSIPQSQSGCAPCQVDAGLSARQPQVQCVTEPFARSWQWVLAAVEQLGKPGPASISVDGFADGRGGAETPPALMRTHCHRPARKELCCEPPQPHHAAAAHGAALALRLRQHGPASRRQHHEPVRHSLCAARQGTCSTR